MKKVILGSASPRRRELLGQIGIEFEVKTSDAKECYQSTIPEEIVKELALQKAENVTADLLKEQGNLEDVIVIGADTIVVQDHKILGKPADKEDAFRMISSLQGRDHQVFTGTALLIYDAEGNKKIVNHAVETKVYVNAMDEQEILTYIDGGEPMDKAGAYGIQGAFAAFIEKIEGDYYNVVGLPVSYIYQELKKAKAV